MPWWGYLLSGIVVYLMGFIAGQAAGRANALGEIVKMSAGAQAMGRMPGLPGGLGDRQPSP